jgi:hypothetical protein
MFFPPFNESKSRYERKFMVPDMPYHQILQQIRNHPAAFSSIFYPRYVNNIYLDSNELDFFRDNVSGKGSRKKARVRWYGDQTGYIGKPVLELKVREGMLGDKISFRLQPFTLNQDFTYQTLLQVFKQSDLPFWVEELLLHLKPTLLNRYKRNYFISFDQNFRITLDDELAYYAIRVNNNTFSERYFTSNVIVELKYNREFDDVAPAVTNKIPFRLTKSSKYVNGIELLNPVLA